MVHAGRSECATANPLASRIHEFHVRHAPLIEALIRLGLEGNVCLGVEALDPDLLSLRTDFDLYDARVSAVIQAILKSSTSALEPVQQDGVIRLRRRSDIRQTWLDTVIPVLNAPRAPLQTINNLLRMTFLTTVKPDINGFAGSYNPGDPTDQIGPFRREGATVRELLNVLVGKSNGAMWIIYGRQDTSQAPGQFWIVYPYSEGIEQILSSVSRLPLTPRN